MSGHYYPPTTSSGEEEMSYNQAYHPTSLPPDGQVTSFVPEYIQDSMAQGAVFHLQTQWYQYSGGYQPIPSYQYTYATAQPEDWAQQSGFIPPQQADSMPFPQYTEALDYFQQPVVAGPSTTPVGYLSPGHASRVRVSRSTSFASNASSIRSISQSDIGSRSTSPDAAEMAKWGVKNQDGSWSCSYPGCISRSTFTRGCDLRKHYKRHTKSLFCRTEGCPQATEGGFSSKKDRARHEAKHNPTILCEWDGCGRLFSRQDNMKDHVRRVHQRRIT